MATTKTGEKQDYNLLACDDGKFFNHHTAV